MKALLLNTLIGIALGRFGSIWLWVVFIPLVAAEVAYGVVAYHLSPLASVRRGIVLLVCAQLAFLLGALLRPVRDRS